MKYHISPKTGFPNICRATDRPCPIGGQDEHYSTKDEARQAFEKKNTNELGATASIKKERKQTLKTSELNSLAKETSDRGEIKQILEFGSERTLKNLGQNPNIDSESLVKGYKAAKTEDARLGITLNKNFPVKEMTGREFVHRMKSYKSTSELKDFVTSPELTNEHYNSVIESVSYSTGINLKHAMLSTPNNISKDLLVEEAESSPHLLNAAIQGGTYPVGRIPSLDKTAIYWGNISRAKSDYLKAYADWALRNNDEKIAIDVAKNPEADDKSLRKLAEKGFALEEVYKNPKARETTRQIALAKAPGLQSIAKIEKLNTKLGKNVRDDIQIKTDVTTHGRYNTHNTVTVELDKDKVKKYDLNDEDIRNIFEAKNYNAGFSYDKDSGVVTMSNDSSD